MKIQCNVCEAAEANVLCCADEAALCWACDEKVHAANKLASKHQRVPLSASHMPQCDICQVRRRFSSSRDSAVEIKITNWVFLVEKLCGDVFSGGSWVFFLFRGSSFVV